MLYLQGLPALSDGALARKLARVRRANPRVRGLTAEHAYFVELESELPARQREVLEALLHYGPARARSNIEGLRLLVVPRIGTISPWS